MVLHGEERISPATPRNQYNSRRQQQKTQCGPDGTNQMRSQPTDIKNAIILHNWTECVDDDKISIDDGRELMRDGAVAR